MLAVIDRMNEGLSLHRNKITRRAQLIGNNEIHPVPAATFWKLWGGGYVKMHSSGISYDAFVLMGKYKDDRERDHCPECGRNSFVQVDYFSHGGGGATWVHQCQNLDCEYRESFSV